MLTVDFLSGNQPITKSYTLNSGGKLVYTPYPSIYEFTSTRETCSSIAKFHAAILKHSILGNCISKGQLKRQLVQESRAGSTVSDEPTSWICLDIDGITGLGSIDQLLSFLRTSDVDYIVQWSSSMSIHHNTGLRCHVFMLLEEPTPPSILKTWLKHLNFSIPLLESQLSLTKTGAALRWPLDITTCQNDKLIYIAPPILNGIADPFPGNNRITLNKRSYRALSIPVGLPIAETINNLTEKKINALRKASNMAPRKFTMKHTSSGMKYLSKPGAAEVTETKTERGFVYLNLNGGNSWGYYHPENNSEFIYNFKGEPTYKTAELLPSYWASLQQHAPHVNLKQAGKQYLAFKEASSVHYYNAIVDEANRTSELFPATLRQLSDFMLLHGQAKLEPPVPMIKLVYQPLVSQVYDAAAGTLNIYQPPELLSAPGKWPTIERTLRHVMGSDQACFQHFINWLASALQKLDSNATAWIWHGTYGTGKGAIFEHVLKPMFGASNVVQKRADELEKDNTVFMENKIIVFIDEMHQDFSFYGSGTIEAKLKSLITEPTITIRKMYKDTYVSHNFSNFIFASNQPAPVAVKAGDRRYNVAEYQDTPIVLTAQDIQALRDETAGFMDFLLAYQVNDHAARTPITTAAKQKMIDTNQLAIEKVAAALNKGDLEFFWDQIIATPVQNPLLQNKYNEYKDFVKDLVTNQPGTLSREDLRILFQHCVGDMPESPNKFTSKLVHANVHMSNVWKDNRTVRGVKVTWKTDPKWLAKAKLEISSGIV